MHIILSVTKRNIIKFYRDNKNSLVSNKPKTYKVWPAVRGRD